MYEQIKNRVQDTEGIRPEHRDAVATYLTAVADESRAVTVAMYVERMADLQERHGYSGAVSSVASVTFDRPADGGRYFGSSQTIYFYEPEMFDHGPTNRGMYAGDYTIPGVTTAGLPAFAFTAVEPLGEPLDEVEREELRSATLGRGVEDEDDEEDENDDDDDPDDAY